MLDYPTAPRGLEAVETLISRVEELVGRLPASDSQIGQLRTQAANALAAAKAAVAVNTSTQAEEPERKVRAYLDAWVRERPRTALAIAATFGLAMGIMAVSWTGWPRRPHR